MGARARACVRARASERAGEGGGSERLQPECNGCFQVDNDYPVYAEAKRRGLLVKSADGASDFEGHCWPGTSSWIDYLNPAARDYWASRFLPSNYVGSTEHLYTWNDMNEPSVFNGPEVTMQKDLRHHQGVEHRDVHNLFGFYMTMATVAGPRPLTPRLPSPHDRRTLRTPHPPASATST